MPSLISLWCARMNQDIHTECLCYFGSLLYQCDQHQQHLMFYHSLLCGSLCKYFVKLLRSPLSKHADLFLHGRCKIEDHHDYRMCHTFSTVRWDIAQVMPLSFAALRSILLYPVPASTMSFTVSGNCESKSAPTGNSFVTTTRAPLNTFYKPSFVLLS